MPGLEYLPEVNRANFVMQQLSNPWLVVTNVGNVVIMWRLLFPIIWYILGLPSTAFLAVPMIGCWAVLAFATHRIKIVTGRWLWAFVGAIVLSGCSWFFISMGWLTYADSWIVLAFVAIAYARSPWCLLVVGILAPWIDERFVIGLPLAILVRILHPVNEPGLATRNPMESMACFPGVIFYVGIRLWALVTRDHTSASFLTVNLDRDARDRRAGHPLCPRALAGNPRGSIFVGWGMIEAFRRSGKVARLVLVAITVPSLIFMLMIAADLSRAPIILLVWFLAGIEYAWRFRPKAAKLLLCLAAVVNFLTPAYQVVANFTIRIEPLWTEVQNLRHPAPGFNARLTND